jgi:endonuclease III
LSREYNNPRLHNKRNPLDELIFILLSSKTSEKSYLSTYLALRKAFKNWFDVLDSPPGAVSRIIVEGGLSNKKEKQLRSLLKEIRTTSKGGTLSFLSKMSTKDAEYYLTSLPGVGLKTARCVLMYSFSRDVFPVDTHVRRILSRLGVANQRRLTDPAQNSIQEAIPIGVRYALHVNLVAHGRAVCKARDPLCSSCVIRDMCSYYNAPRELSS